MVLKHCLQLLSIGLLVAGGSVVQTSAQERPASLDMPPDQIMLDLGSFATLEIMAPVSVPRPEQTDWEEAELVQVTEQAEQGNAYAQFELAFRIFDDKGPEAARPWYDKALGGLQSYGDWPEAIVCARRMLDLFPDDPAVQYQLIVSLYAHCDSKQREENFREATELLTILAPDDRPGYAPAQVFCARRLLRPENFAAKNAPMVERHLKLALRNEPNNTDALVLLAELYARIGKYQDAVAVYARLFEDFPGFYVRIAELYRDMKRSGEAIPFLERAVNRYEKLLADDPGNPNYLRRRANALAFLGEHDQAIRVLQDAIENAEASKWPDAEQALTTALANLYLARASHTAQNSDGAGQWQSKFLDDLGQAYEIDPGNEGVRNVLTQFGQTRFEMAAEAREIYDPRDDPESAPDKSLQVAGTHEIVNGDNELGIRLLELAIEKNPANHESLNNLAFTIMDDDPARALELACRAVDLQPRQAHYRYIRGAIQLRMGNYEESIADFKLARIGLPDYTKLLEAMIECYEKLGLTEDSRLLEGELEQLRDR
ncbi:MAG: tetratricopeptide repeat protein [Pirellulaceae bacterium]